MMLQDLSAANRSRHYSAWAYPLSVAVIVLPLAFEAAQSRHVRRALLLPRRTGVLGPLSVGAITGLLYLALCLAGPLFRWLPSLVVVVGGAIGLSYIGSRALWKQSN